METLLLIVTVTSTGIALGAAFLVWRMRSREEERQRARVAALAAAIDEHALLRDTFAASFDEPIIDGSRGDDAGSPDADARGLFSTAEPVAGAPRRGPALALAAGLAVVLVTGALVVGGARGPAPPTSRSTPLELLSLAQQQDGSRTVISGLVRNPSAGQPVRRLTAVVLFYDRAGAFVASSRAPLDYTTLQPGEESPFTVSLQDASPSATRYRLSFRLDDSGLVPHVDRREKS